MTSMQKRALQAMDALMIGAVNVDGEWLWKEDARESDLKATKIVGKLVQGTK